MPDGETWRCTWEEILAAEKAFYADRQWRGNHMIGFRRWMGMDDHLHAVVALVDGTRTFLDEDELCCSARNNGAERAPAYQWH